MACFHLRLVIFDIGATRCHGDALHKWDISWATKQAWVAMHGELGPSTLCPVRTLKTQTTRNLCQHGSAYAWCLYRLFMRSRFCVSACAAADGDPVRPLTTELPLSARGAMRSLLSVFVARCFLSKWRPLPFSPAV